MLTALGQPGATSDLGCASTVSKELSSTVICLDVLIHYSQEKMEKMISHLCSVAQTRIILSFAPKTLFLTILKKIGSLFPGPSKTTRAYMHKEIDMIAVLKKNGFTLQRNSMIRTRFYFSRLLEATKD